MFKLPLIGGHITKKLKDVRLLLESNKKELREKFKIKQIGIFGSYVRGEQKKTSDVDIIVEFEKPVGLFEFIGLKNHLSDLLKVNVDLVMKKGLRPRIEGRILKEVVYV